MKDSANMLVGTAHKTLCSLNLHPYLRFQVLCTDFKLTPCTYIHQGLFSNVLKTISNVQSIPQPEGYSANIEGIIWTSWNLVLSANVCILLLHQRSVTCRGYRRLLHVWRDECVAIFMEWYNVTDRCYTLQLGYAVIFCSS